MVFFHQNPKLLIAIKDMKILLRKSNLSPTNCREPISGWPNYIGVKDASGHVIGGVVFGEIFPCTPALFRMQYPEWVKRETISSSNRTGTLKNSDLEISGLLLLWLVMEEVCKVKYGDHVAVFSNNHPTVSWVDQLASKSSVVAVKLLHTVAMLPLFSI